MGYKFTLTLSREVTGEESDTLRAAGCAGATISSVSFPLAGDQPVSQLDFDTDTDAAASLTEAIESALEAVKGIPDLSVPSLTVPPYGGVEPPQEPGSPDVVPADVVRDDADVVPEDKAPAVAAAASSDAPAE
jgi:hypothetical protein